MAVNESDIVSGTSRERILSAAKTLFAKEGYDKASTSAIARKANTSESQIMKHFGSKLGVLQEIFESAWHTIDAEARSAVNATSSSESKLTAIAQVVFSKLDADPELKPLLLLEGRRVLEFSLTPAFIGFSRFLDSVIVNLQREQVLLPRLHPHAVRAALIGSVEGTLRDQLVSEKAGYHTVYTSQDISDVLDAVLAGLFCTTAEASLLDSVRTTTDTVR